MFRIKGRIWVLLLMCFVSCGSSLAQSVESYQRLDHVTSFSHLVDGLDVRDGNARMEIRAIKQNILRIRVSPSNDLGEDVSWAVLQEARQSHQPVKPSDDESIVGFHTDDLRVTVDRRTFLLTISD